MVDVLCQKRRQARQAREPGEHRRRSAGNKERALDAGAKDGRARADEGHGYGVYRRQREGEALGDVVLGLGPFSPGLRSASDMVAFLG